MSDYLALARKDPPRAAAVIVTIIGALGICGFFFFQYVMLLAPCPLCLEQRYAFYVCVPLAALLWLGASHGASCKVLFLGFVVIAGFMLWNTGLATYHAGVEWKWWPGPQECTGTPSFGNVNDLHEQLKHAVLVRCDEAAWRFLGLSLAGYNVLISLGLAAMALWGALAKRSAAYGSSSVSQ